MGLRLVGAGFGRTGTLSLKTALEGLLGAPCYHMVEVFGHPDHAPVWADAVRDGRAGDELEAVLAGYVATVDWPACAAWRPLADAHPDAVILLSVRDSADAWWRSASQTIFVGMDDPTAEPVPGWRAMWEVVAERTLAPGFVHDAEAAIGAYEAHNAAVRAEADPARLLEWRPGDGWAPLCDALGVPVPSDPFPHLNTSEEWLARRQASG